MGKKSFDYLKPKLTSVDGAETLSIEEVANQMLHAQLHASGLIAGSEPEPRFVTLLIDELNTSRGVVREADKDRTQKWTHEWIAEWFLDEQIASLQNWFQLRMHEQAENSSHRLARIGQMLSLIGVLVGVLQIGIATYSATISEPAHNQTLQPTAESGG